MRRLRGWALWSCLFFGGCLPPPVRGERSAALGALLEARCAGCHDGQDGRVRLGAAAKPDERLAIRAALMVASARMPKGKPLAEAERDGLLVGLCGLVSRPRDCLAVVKPAPPGIYAKPPLAFWRRVQPAGAEHARGLEVLTAETDRGAENGQMLRTPLDVTFVLNAAALALEQCADPSTFAACARAILSVQSMRFPEGPR